MTTHGMFGRILGSILVCTSAVAASGCTVSAYPENAYVDGNYPPADYIATMQPVYFEGHASYWYNNRWYYRDGGHWGHYDREPAGLAAHRAQFTAGARVNYGRPSIRGGAVARGRR